MPRYEVKPVIFAYHVWNYVRDENGNIVYNGKWPPKTCSKPATYSAYLYRDRSVGCPVGTLTVYDKDTKKDVCGLQGYQPFASANLGTPLAGVVSANSGCTAGLASEESLCGTYGNPVNPANGNKFQIEADFIGGGAFPLEFKRYYNSGRPTSAITAKLGVGWTHSYTRKIQFDERANLPTAYAYRPDGKLWAFSYINGTFSPAYAFTARLQRTDTGYRLTTPGNLIEDYDLEGFLVAVHRQGVTHRLSYNANRELVSVADDAGRTLRFEYTGGWLTKLTDSAGGVFVYSYTGSKLTQVAYPDATVRQYIYDSPVYAYLLTGIIDESGKRFATYTYAADKKVASSEHAGGALRHTFSYADTATTVVTDSGDTVTDSFQVRRGAQLRGGHASLQGVSAKQYSTAGYLQESTSADGAISRYTTDALGRELSRTEAAGTPLARVIETQWHPDFMLPTQLRYPGRTEDLAYDTDGNMVRRTLTAGTAVREWRYAYVSGRLVEVDGPRTDVDDRTVYAYDAQGNLSAITDPSGETTRFTDYDAAGRLLSLEDPVGLVMTYRYDARGRLIELTRGAETMRWQRNAYGAVTQIELPGDVVWNFVYDDAHRLIEITDPQGYRQRFTMNAAGQPLETYVLDLAGNRVMQSTAEYDLAGRLVKLLDADSNATRYGYTAGARLTSVSTPLGATSQTDYDVLGRVLSETDPLSGIAYYRYTATDDLDQVIDPRGVTTTYQPNAFGDVEATHSPDSGTTVRSFDEMGNPVTTQDARGVNIAQEFDALNRLTRRVFSDGSEARFSYAAGTEPRPASLTDSAGTTHWAYDAHGRETRKTQSLDGLDFVTEHRYDAAGHRIETRLPSGVLIGYGYLNGELSLLQIDGQPVITEVRRGYGGQLLDWRYANGRLGGYRRDLSGRVNGFWLGDALTEVKYDAAGRVVGVGESSYYYDAKDRLVQYAGATGSGSFGYDAGDNRAQTEGRAGQTSYAYAADSNRLLSLSGLDAMAYDYDAAGNALAFGQTTFSYDAAGRLASAQRVAKFAYRGQPPAVLASAQYRYNGLGQRVAKAVTGEGATTRYFSYTEGGQLAGEYAADGTPVAEFVYLDGIPVAVIQAGAVYVVQPDHLGTPRRVLDAGGSVVWAWESDPFGTTLPNEDPDGDGVVFSLNLRFPGQHFDAETGLHYNYYRDYNPVTGRYVQSDPIGLAGGLNSYGYVGGDPVRMIDPTGEFGVFGLLVGAGLEMSVQYLTNGGNLRCIDWADVAMMGAIGAVAPSSLASAGKILHSYKAKRVLGHQLENAKTTNRMRKLEDRLNRHESRLAAEIGTQGAIASGKYVSKKLINDSNHGETCPYECN